MNKIVSTFQISLIILAIINSFRLPAQTNSDFYFINYRFDEALQGYLSLLVSNPDNPRLNYKIGKCYLESRSEKEKAIPYLEKAVWNTFVNKSSEKDFLPIAFKELGDAYFLSRNFEKSLKAYETFKNNYSTHSDSNINILPSLEKNNKNILLEVDRKIEMCIFAMDIIGHIDYSLYAPDNKRFYEDIIVDYDTGRKVPSPDTNAHKMQYEATLAVSTDGQVLLMYMNNSGNAELYTTGLNENKWSSRERLNKAVNCVGWEKNETISPDGSIMYFSSSRDGGYGGKDIYKCEKLADGSWGTAKNLGPLINSSFNEEAPFIFSDGITLFFSSDRNRPVGSEIFSSISTGKESWSEIVSVGFPVVPDNTVNSEQLTDDITVNKTSNLTGEQYFSSKNENHEIPGVILPDFIQSGITGNNNYVISFFDQNKSQLLLFKGRVRDKNGDIPKQTSITVTDNETGKVSGIYIIDQSGKYSLNLPLVKNSNITFEAEGYIFNSVNVDALKANIFFEERQHTPLEPLMAGSEISLNNIFFSPANPGFSHTSLPELNNILNMLLKNRMLKVSISYFMEYNKATAKTNATLANNRVQSLVNFLYKNGIQKDRVVASAFTKVPKGKTAGCILSITDTGILYGSKQ